MSLLSLSALVPLEPFYSSQPHVLTLSCSCMVAPIKSLCLLHPHSLMLSHPSYYHVPCTLIPLCSCKMKHVSHFHSLVHFTPLTPSLSHVIACLHPPPPPCSCNWNMPFQSNFLVLSCIFVPLKPPYATLPSRPNEPLGETFTT